MTHMWVKETAKKQALIAACILSFAAFPAIASAQNADDTVSAPPNANAWAPETLTKTPVEFGGDLRFTAPVTDSNRQLLEGMTPELRDSLFDVAQDTSTPLFKLDLNGGLCLRTSVQCDENEQQALDLGIAEDFVRPSFGKFDLALTPRASVQFDDASSSATVGALFKFGDGLISDAPVNENTWYFFAGADAQAVTYVPGSPRNIYRGAFALQDRIIVGDAQAGVSYRVGDADVSLTYLRREGRAEDYKYTEDAAALSLTWRH